MNHFIATPMHLLVGRVISRLTFSLFSIQPPVRGRLRQVRPDECPPGVQQLLVECINADVAARPDAGQILERLQAIVRRPTAHAAENEC